jgi:hypothetical protein
MGCIQLVEQESGLYPFVLASKSALCNWTTMRAADDFKKQLLARTPLETTYTNPKASHQENVWQDGIECARRAVVSPDSGRMLITISPHYNEL